MNLCQYCKEQGMTKDQYKTFARSIEQEAQTAFIKALRLHPTCTGMYYPIEEILPAPFFPDEQIKTLIIQELKKAGMEFREKSTLWRI